MPQPKLLCPFLLLVTLSSTVSAQSYSGPVIDAHAHVRLADDDGITSDQPKGIAALRALDDASGISKSALIVMAGGGPEATRKENDSLLAAVASDPDHFYAVASVHPADGDAALTELERLAGFGVKFIKLHPNSQEFDIADPAVARVTEHIGTLGMSVLIDSYDPFDPGQIGKFVKLTMSQPNTRFVLAHMGFVRFRETLVFAQIGKMGAPRNVWFDISAIVPTYAVSPVKDELIWTMRQIGMDRMIFGSDWPVDKPESALKAAKELALTEAEQRQLFHDNIAGLLTAQ